MAHIMLGARSILKDVAEDEEVVKAAEECTKRRQYDRRKKRRTGLCGVCKISLQTSTIGWDGTG